MIAIEKFEHLVCEIHSESEGTGKLEDSVFSTWVRTIQALRKQFPSTPISSEIKWEYVQLARRNIGLCICFICSTCVLVSDLTDIEVDACVCIEIT